MKNYEKLYSHNDIARIKEKSFLFRYGKAQARIIEWYRHYDGNVYVSFSGGKDSTLLLYMVRSLFPEVPAVFVDTGLEFPEIRDFVKTVDNVVWIKPLLRFDKVIHEYGYPVISKDVSRVIYYARKGSSWALNKLNGINNDGTYSAFKQRYIKWQYLLDAPFGISDLCCYYLKKEPLHRYERMTGRKPIIGTTIYESNQRMDAWRKTGCNAFDGKYPMSKAMSLLTEQDILMTLYRKGKAISSVYGDITHNNFTDIYAVTGEQRTGCMFCMYGCHLDKVNRFQRMAVTHPKQYEYCINGFGIGTVLDYIGVNYKLVQLQMEL